jgi:hypothetical protein
METLIGRVRNVLADALMLFVLPLSIALLPWALGFRLLKWVARRESVYRLAVDPAWEAAKRHLGDHNEREWKTRFRLLRLVDHVDVYLTLLRGRNWRARNIAEAGSWPAPGACVFLTYHWGAGNWIWPRLREQGFDACFVMQRPQGRSHGLTRLSHGFAHLRVWCMRRAGSGGVVFTGGSSGEVAAALRGGRSVVGMLDLPARAEQRSEQVDLLDGRVTIPTGLARIGAENEMPIALFSMGLDFESGRRDLRVESLPANLSVQQIAERYAAHLDARLRAAPEAWQIWREAPAMFVAR